MDRLGVRQADGSLYWDGKEIVTRRVIRLRWFELTLATIVSLSTLGLLVVEVGKEIGWERVAMAEFWSYPWSTISLILIAAGTITAIVPPQIAARYSNQETVKKERRIQARYYFGITLILIGTFIQIAVGFDWN